MTKQVSWSELTDAYGSAVGTPDLLAALRAPSASSRAAARAALHDRYVTDEPVTALPEVVKALASLAFDPTTVEVDANVRLVVDLVMVDPDAYLFEPFGGAKAVKAMDPLERDAYEAFAQLAPALERALHDAHPRLRAVACLAISFLVEASPLDTLEHLAAHDPVEDVRASALFALARFARNAPAKTRTRVAKLVAGMGGAPAAIATSLLGADLERQALDDLAAALLAPARPREDLPWAQGDLGDVAAGILRAQGDRARPLASAVVTAVERGRDRAQMRDASLALHLLLPEHAGAKRPLAVGDLTAEQRGALERMARAQAAADYDRYGLPTSPTQLLELLAAKGGVDGGGDAPPIERVIAVPGKGERPAWQWFSALFDREVERDALLTALRACFTPPELLAVLRDATRGAFGAPLPPMALVFDAVAHLGDDREAYLRLAEETLASQPVAAPPAALLAALPLARMGLTDERYDPLFSRVFRGNDKTVVAEFEKLLPADVAARVKPKRKPVVLHRRDEPRSTR